MVLTGSAVVVVAQDAKPAPPRTRLPADYRQLDLSDDQKSKLLGIREQADTQIEAIRAKEQEDMLSVLTDAQQSQLKEIDAKLKEEAHARRSEEELQQRIAGDQQKLDDLKDQPTTNPAPQN